MHEPPAGRRGRSRHQRGDDGRGHEGGSPGHDMPAPGEQRPGDACKDRDGTACPAAEPGPFLENEAAFDERERRARRPPGDDLADRQHRQRKAARGLNDGVGRRDRGFAVATSPPEQEPAEDRHVVTRPHDVAAGRAGRPAMHHRPPVGHAVDHHIDETPHHRSDDERRPHEHRVFPHARSQAARNQAARNPRGREPHLHLGHVREEDREQAGRVSLGRGCDIG